MDHSQTDNDRHCGHEHNTIQESIADFQGKSCREASCEESYEETEKCLPSIIITSLPEVVLVRIMTYLNLKERYYLSLSCHLFYQLFSHPSLWQRANIMLFPLGSGGKNQMRWKLKSMMQQTMVEIVKRFSHLFQHLTLDISGYVQRFDDNCLQLLKELSNECRLKSLCLRLGPVTSSDSQIRRRVYNYSNIQDLPQVMALLKNASHLKYLNIISWPLHIEGANNNHDIFAVMMDNEKLMSLTSLSLFFIDINDTLWTERIPELPSVETTLKLVNHFRNISHLALRSPMLNDKVILQLASKRRAQLNTMQVLIMYSRDSRFLKGFAIPDISSSSWSALKASSPFLEVEFVVLTRIPQENLSLMLRPEIPLTSFSILYYGKCDSCLIDILAEKYQLTLRNFVCLCDSSECDSSLISLVNLCRSLHSLKFHGDVYFETVIKISEVAKEKDWDCFEFKKKSIKTENNVNHDNDVVVAKDEESEQFYLPGVYKWHQNEDEHKLDEMVKQVSENLGFTWLPI